MFVIKLERLMAQRRSPAQLKENLVYLANHPRKSSLEIQNVDVEAPERTGLLYQYRGVIRYAPKENEKQERIRKD
jgi:hypothetical protein